MSSTRPIKAVACQASLPCLTDEFGLDIVVRSPKRVAREIARLKPASRVAENKKSREASLAYEKRVGERIQLGDELALYPPPTPAIGETVSELNSTTNKKKKVVIGYALAKQYLEHSETHLTTPGALDTAKRIIALVQRKTKSIRDI